MNFFLIFVFCIAISLQGYSQTGKVTVSGIVYGKQSNAKLPYVNVVIKNAFDSVFVAGTVTSDEGLFSVSGISPGDYILELSYLGYSRKQIPILVGSELV